MLVYKTDIIGKLKEKGYTSFILRKEKLISENTLQYIRQQRPLSAAALDTVCGLLECQPGDIIGYVPDGGAVPEVKKISVDREKVNENKTVEKAHDIIDRLDDKKLKAFIELFS